MPVTRNHLRRNRFDAQPQPLGDEFLHARIEMRERADCAADRRHRDLRSRRNQPRSVARELRIMPGQFDPERRRLGMDAVAPPDRQRVLVLERACLQRRQHVIDVPQQQIGSLRQLDRKTCVQHIRRLSCPDAETGYLDRSTPRAMSETRSRHGAFRARWHRCGRYPPVQSSRPSHPLARGWCARRLAEYPPRGPCLQPPGLRSRTRSDSDFPAPRCRPFQGGSNEGPLTCE